MPHLNCFFSSWTVATCVFRLTFCPKFALQMSHLNGFWNNSDVIFVMLTLGKQFMKETNNSNVTFVILTLDKMSVWIHMLQLFMKESKNSNVTFVMLTLDKKAVWTQSECCISPQMEEVIFKTWFDKFFWMRLFFSG